ncbi:MAG: SIS domain-containing protein [Candidatus Humimicrobiaceae bacterium]
MDNSNHTYKEIKGQIKSWKENFNEITGGKTKISMDLFSQNFDRIVFFGCGTSYNLAMASSFFTNTVSGFDSIALPSSELLFNSETYINKSKNYLLIGYSRSGETTESVEVINKFKDQNKIKTFAFTCREKNSFIDISGNHYLCRDAKEKSVAMTRSFSSMLFSYCVMLTRYMDHKNRLKEFSNLCTYLESKMFLLFGEVKEYIAAGDFNSYFALGSGFNYPLAVEADLKMKEMSQIPDYSYHIFEFNHGPKALLSEDCLVLFLTISKKLRNVDAIMDEIIKNRSRIAIIGKGMEDIKKSDRMRFFLDDASFKDELVESFINIPVFQILAYIKTIKQNLNPDKPKGLDYTTRLNV